MRHVPWFTLAVSIVFFMTPLGQSIVQSVFYSGEALSNSIGQFLLLVVAGIVIALALLECGIKYFVRRRRAPDVARG
jgi:hypothetical protein